MDRPRRTILVIAFLLGACGGASGPAIGSASTTTVTVTSSTQSSTSQDASTSVADDGLPAATSVDDAGALAIESKPFPDWITIGGDSAWVANVDTGVGRYDLTSGKFLGSAPVGVAVCLAMDFAFEAIWVGNCDTTTVARINVADGAVLATVTLPFAKIAEESSIAAGEGAVWVLSGDLPPVIARIDPTTNQVASTFPAPEGSTAVRAGQGGLWVTRSTKDLLTRLDPATGAEVASVEVSDGGRFLAIGEGGVWVLGSNSGEVTRVDPVTNEVVATIKVSTEPVQGGDIAVGGGLVWARLTDELVAAVDPASNMVVARYGPAAGSGSVAADASAAWISAHDVTTVWRLPRT